MNGSDSEPRICSYFYEEFLLLKKRRGRFPYQGTYLKFYVIFIDVLYSKTNQTFSPSFLLGFFALRFGPFPRVLLVFLTKVTWVLSGFLSAPIFSDSPLEEQMSVARHSVSCSL